MKIKHLSRILQISLLLIASAGLAQNQEAIHPSSYIFNESNLTQNALDLASIYETMGKYYKAVEKSEAALLEEVFHKDWFMRDTDTPNETTLNVEDKSTFIKRIRDRGPYTGYAAERVFATTGMANDNLAFIRINKASSRNSTSFFLFKTNNQWIIMDKVWVNVREAYVEVRPAETYMEVEKVLNTYFTALAGNDQPVLRSLFHEQWDLKSVNSDGKITQSSKAKFLESIPKEGISVDYNQLLSIDCYHDRLAIVRIDLPAQLTTSFLTFFKVAGEWQIVGERRTEG